MEKYFVALGKTRENKWKKVILPLKWIRKCPEKKAVPEPHDCVWAFYCKNLEEAPVKLRGEKYFDPENTGVYKFQITSVESKYFVSLNFNLKHFIPFTRVVLIQRY